MAPVVFSILKTKRRYWIAGIIFICLASALFYPPFNIYRDEYEVLLNLTAIDEVDVNYPRIVENVPFNYFNDKNIFTVKSGVLSEQLDENDKLFKTAKRLAAQYVQCDVTDFQYGQYRLLGNGVEFDIYFRTDEKSTRVNLFLPFGSPKHIYKYEPNHKTVHIILPLKGKLSSLSKFAENFAQNIYPTEKDVTLTVVYFNDTLTNKAHYLLKTKLSSVPEYKWHFITTNERTFSRGKGLVIGANHVGKSLSNLLFFCDVDIIIKPDFFHRCRSNAVLGRQVYFPIVFSLYNPAVVYSSMAKSVPKWQNEANVEQNNGFWRNFGYGMACLHKGDFDSVGGIPDINSWGGEDVEMFNKLSSRNNIKYIRGPDPSLIHLYHYKDCRNVSKSSMKSCLTSKVIVEGNQLQLGLALFKINEGLDIAAALRHRPMGKLEVLRRKHKEMAKKKTVKKKASPTKH